MFGAQGHSDEGSLSCQRLRYQGIPERHVTSTSNAGSFANKHSPPMLKVLHLTPCKNCESDRIVCEVIDASSGPRIEPKPSGCETKALTATGQHKM